MLTNELIYEVLSSASFLEYAFLRWVLTPACLPMLASRITAQREVSVSDRTYRIDYEIAGHEKLFAIELDGFEFHRDRPAFTYDRLRQNDLAATGRIVLRFSYDSIRLQTERCVEQLQAAVIQDTLLRRFLVPHPVIEIPAMDPNPLYALAPLTQEITSRVNIIF